MSACYRGGGIHQSEYLCATTTGSGELKTYEQAKVANLDLMGHSMQDAEYDLRGIVLPRTPVNKGAPLRKLQDIHALRYWLVAAK